ncbi:hypothetical protein F4821DRAFT_274581 [Hypoxylon rubiginosum]|uniref:Uncharacterized protein n=1 Tax=Hypoxylon rubiginosum TaxID=110542 RepID=A0ACC0CNE5_9PEZI|nr:hypothetical protein F4821DRAFT_274581 [Hypoxylon rubiginosum]
MYFNTYSRAAAFALAMFATAALASPIDDTATVAERGEDFANVAERGEDIATVATVAERAAGTQAPRANAGTCFYNGLPFSYNYQLTIDSTQNGGLCGGFWDNLKGRANCAGKSNNACKVVGSTKIIEFTVGDGCKPDEVLGVLWHATEPRLEGVKCENKVFIWETQLP